MRAKAEKRSDVDSKYYNVLFELLPGGLKHRQLCTARRTVTCPEVQHYGLPGVQYRL